MYVLRHIHTYYYASADAHTAAAEWLATEQATAVSFNHLYIAVYF